jgi:hypothetical protein
MVPNRMRTSAWLPSIAAALILVGTAAAVRLSAQTTRQPLLDQSGYVREDAYIPAPLPASERAYAAIDGRRMKALVNEFVAISRRSRDDGNKYLGADRRYQV